MFYSFHNVGRGLEEGEDIFFKKASLGIEILLSKLIKSS